MADDSRFRIEDERFESASYAPQTERPKRSALSTCLTGCLIALVVLLVLGGIVAYWVANNWRDWFSDFGAEALKQTIRQTELPAAEREEINVQIDRVAVAFREKNLSSRQMADLLQQIVDSPLMTTLATSMIEKQYVAASGLSDEEKATAQVTLQRYLRGAIDGKISQQNIDKAMQPVADRQPDGTWQLRDRVTDDELRAFLKTAQEQADAAGIPAETETVDPSEEFKRIVDEALGESADAAEVPAATATEDVKP